MPKISIITINYNNLEGLKKTVESVVNQTWQEFKYIVINGGFVFNHNNVNALMIII